MDIYQIMFYFFIYGFLGWCTEVAFASVKERRFVNRGFLSGPICPVYGVGVGAVVVLLGQWKENLLFLYAASVVLVSFIEWATGVILDKLFHHKWWDYSERPLNIGGYVCLLFSLVWGAACVFIVKIVHPFVERLVLLLPELVGVGILILLVVGMAADMIVTAAGILKLNRRLDAMERIAAELKEISDKMGENIYENVMDTLERLEKMGEGAEERKAHIARLAEEKKERVMELAGGSLERAAEIREHTFRMEELRRRYREVTASRNRVGERLLKAFPKMKSRRHNERLRELKERISKRK